MKLNPDCIRDILLSVEERPFSGTYRFSDLVNALSSYTADEIEYCCLKLSEAKILDIGSKAYINDPAPRVLSIKGMTFAGHEFLDKIRDKGAWAKHKDKFKAVGAVATDLAGQIIAGIISAKAGQ